MRKFFRRAAVAVAATATALVATFGIAHPASAADWQAIIKRPGAEWDCLISDGTYGYDCVRVA